MKKAISLTTDPISELTWRIALPASVGLFFNTLFNIVDTYCAGKLGTLALAALSLSFPLYFMMIAIGSGLSQGATALVAQALGRADLAAARRLFAQSLLLAAAAGTSVGFLGWISGPALLRALGAQGEGLAETMRYLNGIFSGAPFFFLTMTLNAGLSAQGETRPYRNILIAASFANAALNPLLMWGTPFFPGLGVTGIACATVIIQIASGICLILPLRSTPLGRTIPHLEFRPDLPVLLALARQSIPAALNMMTIAAGVAVMIAYVKPFGQEAVAALGIATRIEQIVLMPAIGLGSAMLSLVGQNHGAGLPHRVREAWSTNLRNGVTMMALGGILVASCGEMLMKFFTADPTIIHYGGAYLRAAAVTLGAYPILFVTVFMMQGLGRPRYGLWIGIYRQILAPLLAYQTLAVTLGWGTKGIWWGMAMVTWSAALFALAYGWKVCRDLNA